MELAHPWLLALAPLPILAWIILPAARERGAVRVPASVLAHLLTQSAQSSGSRAVRPGELAFKTIGWIALILALAGPYLKRPAILAPTGRDIIIAFDLSASMAEKDMVIADRKVARIDVIRNRLGSFIQNRKGDRFALIGFASDAYLIAPLTFDVTAIAEMLDEMTIGLPGRKTDLGQAIGLAVKLLRPEPTGERLLILISDGEVNAGELAATDAAKLAKDIGVRIFSIGFAEEISAKNAAHLADLANITDGAFHAASSTGLMQNALADIEALAPIAPGESAIERRQDWRWPLLLISLLCLMAIGWQEYRDP
ncbi:MAG: VWA domain-containing protein [Pseudomonadota bacterium]